MPESDVRATARGTGAVPPSPQRPPPPRQGVQQRLAAAIDHRQIEDFFDPDDSEEDAEVNPINKVSVRFVG